MRGRPQEWPGTAVGAVAVMRRGVERVSWLTQSLLGTVKGAQLSWWGASSRTIKRYLHLRFLFCWPCDHQMWSWTHLLFLLCLFVSFNHTVFTLFPFITQCSPFTVCFKTVRHAETLPLFPLGDQVSVYWNQSDCQDAAIGAHLRGGLGGGCLSQDMATQQEGYLANLNAWCGRRTQSLQGDATFCWS